VQIDIIDNLASLYRLREDWKTVYRADREAHFFLSWTWMSTWFEKMNGQWLILAARENAAATDCIAFFPLRLRTKIDRKARLYNEIAMGGNRVADYTGLLCIPEYDEKAIPAFARTLKAMHWTRLHLEGFRASQDRLQHFLKAFPSRTFTVSELRAVNPDGTDNHICPLVDLPSDWDTYLARLSTNTRQKLRRLLRKIEDSGEFRITHATDATIDRDIDTLLRFWVARWGEHKGERAQSIQKHVRNLLRHWFDVGILFMPTLWQGDRPLGVLGSIIDRDKRSLLFWVAGRDDTVSNLSPGLVLHAHSIRYAIASGLTTYDFLRGNEAYKYSFGAREHAIKHLVISTCNRRNLGERLERRSLPVALRLASEMHQASRFLDAERGYRQILETEPRYGPALYAYAQLKAHRRDLVGAERLFRDLVAVEPHSAKARLGLARSLGAQQRFAEAAEVCRDALRLRPQLAAAHTGLGDALSGLGDLVAATAAYEAARRLETANGQAESATRQ
jgi:CelD/BcsL family acetyltransferase involved in cellulose biosynthesis